MRLSCGIFHVVARRFVELDTDLIAVVELLGEDLPNHKTDVFGSGIKVFELGHFEVKILVVELAFYMLLDHILEYLQVDEIPRFGIDLARYTYLQLIVVPVVILIVA